jgi:hypothetical protein
VLELNSISRVFGINLFGYQQTTIALLSINNNNDRALGRIANPSSLLVDNNLAVRQLSSYIANSAPEIAVPLRTVMADIVIIVDTTFNLNLADFNTVTFLI